MVRDKKLLSNDFMKDEGLNVNGSFKGSSKRKIRKVHPLGMRVLVRIRKSSAQTDSGLYLPETARNNDRESLLCDVIEVARAVDDDTEEDANISGIPANSVVLIPLHSGIKVPWDEDLRIVETKDVLAIVSEVPII